MNSGLGWMDGPEVYVVCGILCGSPSLVGSIPTREPSERIREDGEEGEENVASVISMRLRKLMRSRNRCRQELPRCGETWHARVYLSGVRLLLLWPESTAGVSDV